MCVTRLLHDGLEDARGLDLAQAHVRARRRRDRPGEGPARAVEHRQRPQIAAVVVELEGERIGERAEIGAAVAVDGALGIAGGAARCRAGRCCPTRRPGRSRRMPGSPEAMKLSYSTPPKLGAPAVSASAMSTTIGRLAAELLQRRRDGGVELAVGEEQLGLAVLQAEGDQRRIEADVDRVEHRADHRRRVVRLQHGRDVGGQNRHRIAAPDAGLGQGMRQPPRAGVELGVGEPAAAVDDGRAVAEEVGRAREEADRAQRHEVGRALAQLRSLGRHVVARP